MRLTVLSGFPPLKARGEKGKWKEIPLPAPLGQKQLISIRAYKEKQTDVNLGAHIGADASAGKCDCIALLSGDSDFAGALRMVRRIAPSMEILLVLPASEKDVANELRKVSSRSITVRLRHIRKARFPDRLILSPKNGNREDRGIVCPRNWIC